ncbi:hypothetical protein CFP56_032789 [Quercus suber]|uniref:Uncharacterized protein n=1 Tax=Quercus suber TaxID=58331 RepID=A0AAW0JFW2_QUESU
MCSSITKQRGKKCSR